MECFTDCKSGRLALLWLDRDDANASTTHESVKASFRGSRLESLDSLQLVGSTSRPVHLIFLVLLKGTEVRTTFFGHVHDIKRHAHVSSTGIGSSPLVHISLNYRANRSYM